MILADVAAILFLALVAHAWSHDFAQSIEVIAFQPKSFLDFLSHLFRPRLSAKGTHAQLNLVFRDTQTVHCLSEVKRIRWCAGDARDAEVANEFQVLLGVARASRDNRCSEVLYSVVCSQTAGKQSVAVAHRERVVA